MAITLDGTNGITTPDVDTDSIGTDTSTPFAIRTNGADRVTVDASGNLLVDKTSASGLGAGSVSVAGTVTASGPLAAHQTSMGVLEYNNVDNKTSIRSYGATAGTGIIAFNTGGGGGSADAERARIDASGNLLVGTTSSIGTGPARLEVNGIGTDGRAINTKVNTTGSANHLSFNNPNGQIGSISSSASSTSYNTSSDYRLKENVVPLAGAADRLSQIPVHRFNFITDPDTTVDGFLAHEVQEFVPEAITGTKDEVDDEGKPVYQGIDQSKLVPLLTAALQEALQKIDDLTARISALETSA